MKQKYTHTGLIVGCDNRTPDNYKKAVLLRQTANFWVTEYGTKYRKDSGWMTGETWPLYMLDVNSIKEILK